MATKHITIVEIEYVAHRLATETFVWNEPIPEFVTRYPNILEQCVVAPFQTYDKKQLYSGLIAQAAILFYLMIKNHPFQNGNKRIAMATLFYFLFSNKKWIKVDDQELYNFAKWVAESNAKLKNETVSAVEKFLETYVVGLV
jgi:death-on-curing family protein